MLKFTYTLLFNETIIAFFCGNYSIKIVTHVVSLPNMNMLRCYQTRLSKSSCVFGEVISYCSPHALTTKNTSLYLSKELYRLFHGNTLYISSSLSGSLKCASEPSKQFVYY